MHMGVRLPCCTQVLFRYACDIRNWCVADLWPRIDSSISHHVTPDDTSATSVRAWKKLLSSYVQRNRDRHNSSQSIKRVNSKLNKIPTQSTKKCTIHLLWHLKYNVALSIPKCFDPQIYRIQGTKKKHTAKRQASHSVFLIVLIHKVVTFREPNKRHTAQRQVSHSVFLIVLIHKVITFREPKKGIPHKDRLATQYS